MRHPYFIFSSTKKALMLPLTSCFIASNHDLLQHAGY